MTSKYPASANDWRPIQGTDKYLISSEGRVWSVHSGRELRTKLSKVGYMSITLRDGIGTKYVHHLVASSWIGPKPSPDHVIDHIDEDRTNNRVSNLEWVTRKENASRASKSGTLDKRKRGRKRFLTEGQVYEARRLRAGGATYQSIAAAYKVDGGTIRNAVHGRTYSDFTEVPPLPVTTPDSMKRPGAGGARNVGPRTPTDLHPEEFVTPLPGERWKRLTGNVSGYWVSDQARVFSGKSCRLREPQTRSKRQGYPCIQLRTNEGGYRNFQLHRLVAEYFLEEPSPDLVLAHINEDPADARASNLKWMTRRENAQRSHQFKELGISPPDENTKWAPIPDFPGYEVSDQGHVWSDYGGGGFLVGKRERGYAAVHLCRPGYKEWKRVHGLVANAFVPGKSPVQWSVNHIDGNKLNNKASNLEWASFEEQLEHAIETGLRAVGERVSTAKLTEAQVLEICQRTKNGESQKSLMEEFNTSQPTISSILTGRSWSHVTGIEFKPRKKPRRVAGVRPCLEGEQWKVVEGYPSYDVSDQGRIWSRYSGKLLHTSEPNQGAYVKVPLTAPNGNISYRMVHGIVANAFVPGKCLVNWSVDHIDRDPMNNRASNLRWADNATQQKNKKGPHVFPKPIAEGEEWTQVGDSLIWVSSMGRTFSRKTYRLLKTKPRLKSPLPNGTE